MGLSLFKFVHWAAKEWKDASFLHHGAFWFWPVWPFKVIQGRSFWYQSKARRRLPISPSLWLWSYLLSFLRYGDLLAKNCLFWLYACLPRSLCSLWNFAVKLTFRKLESWTSEDRMIVAWIVLTSCDKRSDRQTVGRTVPVGYLS